MQLFQLVTSWEAARKSVLHGTTETKVIGASKQDVKLTLSQTEDISPRGGTAAHVSEKLPLQYASNSIPFKASDEARRTFMPPSDSFHPLTPDKMADFVFVTAASSNHFNEVVDAIASIQTLMPRKRIYFFDIGLKADQITKVWCTYGIFISRRAIICFRLVDLLFYIKHNNHLQSNIIKD